MNLLPSKTITLVTDQPRESVLLNLRHIDKADPDYPEDDLIDHFVQPSKGAFGPVIKGTVETYGKETLIKADIRINNIAIGFFGIWTLGFLYWSVIAFMEESGQEHYDPYPFIPLAMIVAFYVVMVMSFNFEARRLERKLRTILTIDFSVRFSKF